MKMTNTIAEVLGKMQKEINAPKNQYNSFGKYYYRNVEDILGAAKVCMPSHICMNLTDDVLHIGERYYIKSTASITDGEKSLSSSAVAREPLDKKGMDSAQITGAASSYSRKYALCALFAIDDSKLEAVGDLDSADHRHEAKPRDLEAEIKKITDEVQAVNIVESLRKKCTDLWKIYPHLADKITEICQGRAAVISALEANK